jgi:hypothetical protein
MFVELVTHPRIRLLGDWDVVSRVGLMQRVCAVR